MPTKVTKACQQELVADFIYEKNLELCMFIYLDAFIDIHFKKYGCSWSAYDESTINALLETSYLDIREKILEGGLLTKKAAGKYMMTLNR